jgi:hypothetical protein
MTVYTDIEKARAKLIQQAIKKGISENFGQTEVRKLKEKHGDLGLIRDFENWCMNLDLNELHYLK